MGSGFLFYLYKAIDECDDTDLIVISNNNNVVGFITGATSGLGSVYSYLLRHYFFKVLLVLMPHLFNFTKVKKIIEIMLHTSEKNSDLHHPKAELLSLAIHKDFRGSGSAQILFNSLIYSFQKKGLRDFKIIVGSELHAAHKFYKKMGAVKIDTINVHENSNSIIYRLVLNTK